MFGFIKRKKNPVKQEQIEEQIIDQQPAESETPVDQAINQLIDEPAQNQTSEMTEKDSTAKITESPTKQPAPEKKSWFTRVKKGLSRTRANFSDGLANVFLGKKVIDDELLEDIETQLLTADVGVEATSSIIKDLTDKSARKELANPEAMFTSLKTSLADMLESVDKPLEVTSTNTPFVILMVGINGVGKTTTIGKLAKKYKAQGKSVMLAAGDTFRAAAVEQLQAWGDRNEVPVIAQHTGADSASVLFDALNAAKTRNVDVLIADTAGRLHNKDNLMGELEKIVRVMKKLDPNAPHEVMLVLDAGTGQNAINQAREFNKCVNVTGLTLTKLDGTAKGGVIFALAKQLNIPIRFIGVGEQAEDLRDFHAKDFVKALFETH
ncbi:signal recognition particle-docking protein FtsY [Marinicellulosiphila megalodicopiae]|uniref:signal recognition particle-docking protein FtsY n=1 Tax=Marinicellulosiphila megalodicopiae TaxID=2724896 RepID=UPI003BB0D230